MSASGGFACPRCHTIVQVGQPACPKCGQPFAWEAPVAPVPVAARGAAPLGSNKGTKKSALLWAGLALLVIALGVGGLAASGLLSKLGKAPDPGLAQVQETAPVLAAKGDAPPPSLNLDGMPDDIRAWLQHLERIEKKRGALAQSQALSGIALVPQLQASSLHNMLNGDDEDPNKTPAQSAKVNIDAFRSGWEALDADFKSLPPPRECVPIAEKYEAALSHTEASILDTIQILQDSAADPEHPDEALAKLRSKMGASNDQIDKPAVETDGLVLQICNKYKTIKWFSIHGDYGSNLMNMFGGGVPGLGL